MTIHITDIPNESFNHYKHVLHVDNEFALIEINKDNISDLSKFNYPYKAEAFTLCIVLKGWVKGKINSIEYNAIAPCIISIYPNQILQHDSNRIFISFALLLPKTSPATSHRIPKMKFYY